MDIASNPNMAEARNKGRLSSACDDEVTFHDLSKGFVFLSSASPAFGAYGGMQFYPSGKNLCGMGSLWCIFFALPQQLLLGTMNWRMLLKLFRRLCFRFLLL
ncbi:Uncharacterized protein Rs2_21347 [Raphanus sativus]|nr:Uncharacterized protein Rs2_21347 [Raphanus sativus]